MIIKIEETGELVALEAYDLDGDNVAFDLVASDGGLNGRDFKPAGPWGRYVCSVETFHRWREITRRYNALIEQAMGAAERHGEKEVRAALRCVPVSLPIDHRINGWLDVIKELEA